MLVSGEWHALASYKEHMIDRSELENACGSYYNVTILTFYYMQLRIPRCDVTNKIVCLFLGDDRGFFDYQL